MNKNIINEYGQIISKPTSIKEILFFIEKHWLITSFIFTLGITYIKYLINCFYFAKAEYFNIDITWINSSTDYFTYKLAFHAIGFIMYTVWNCFVYFLISKCTNKSMKFISLLLINIFTIAVLFMIMLLETNLSICEFINISNSKLFSLLIMYSLLSIMCNVWGIIFALIPINYANKKQGVIDKLINVIYSFRRKHPFIIGIIIAIIIIIFQTLLICNISKSLAKYQTIYKTTNEYVILGEKEDAYICSPIIEKDDNILVFDSNKQIIVSNQNIQITIHNYSQVHTQGQQNINITY